MERAHLIHRKIMNTSFSTHLLKSVTALLLLAVLSVFNAISQEASDIDNHLKFREGNELFGVSENYQSALEKYLSIEKTRGLSPNLAFNIASCYYNLGELGKSRLYIEKVLLIDPQNPDARNNLRVLLKKLNLEEPESSMLDAIAKKISSDLWLWTGFALIVLPFGILFITSLLRALRHGGSKPQWTAGSVFSSTVLLLLGAAFIYLSHYNANLSHCGIVIVKQASLRQSPFEQSEPTASITEGRKIQILQKHDNYFLCIDKTSAIRGWISRENLAPVIE